VLRTELKVKRKANSMKVNNKKIASGNPKADPITEAIGFFIRHVRTATVKRRVVYVLFTMVSMEMLFLSMHPHYEIGGVEIVETSFVCLLGVVLYFTDVHQHFMSLFTALYKRVELDGFDRFQYFIADVVAQISSRVRKTHTGRVSHNMLMFLLGMLLLVFLLFLGH